MDMPLIGTGAVEYGKCPKISNILFHMFLAFSFLFIQLFIKILSGMVNSVDPDQTAPLGAVWSESALLVYAISLDTLVYEILGHLPYHVYPVLLWYASNAYFLN